MRRSSPSIRSCPPDDSLLFRPAPLHRVTLATSAAAADAPALAGRIGHVVPHVHWDRAWYLPFQQYRYRLIEFLDDLLDLMEDPDAHYPTFELDGQTVVLEDYLELRPEQAPRIRALVEAGRLSIGPWYVLPDEYIVGGEALVRNLIFGSRIARAFGGRNNVGYVPDPFGHVAQLPAILRGAGLDSFIFTRGAPAWVGDCGGVFEWTASDGETSVLAVKNVPDYPALMAWGFEEQPLLRKDDRRVDVETAMGRMERLLDLHDGEYNWSASHLLFGQGSDHTHPQPTLPMLLREANERFGERLELRHSTLRRFIDGLHGWWASQGSIHQHVGELHAGWDRALLSGVLSARLYLKRQNDHALRLLGQQVEPLAAMAWTAGGRRRQERLQLAWREVLRNHPHDDICGCSVDAAHNDMEVRFRHAGEVATMLLDDLQQELGARLDLTHPDADAIPLLLHNPLGVPWSGELELDVILPAIDAWSDTRTRVGCSSGPRQVAAGTAFGSGLWLTPPEWRLHCHPDRVSHVKLPRAVGHLIVEDLPPGISVAHLVPGAPEVMPDGAGVRTALPDEDTLWVDNGLLRVVVRHDGRFDLIDLQHGRTMGGIARLEDDEDAGDSYDHSPGGHPVPVGEAKAPGLVKRAEHLDRRWHDQLPDHVEVDQEIMRADAWSATLRIQVRWHLPAWFDDATQLRAKEHDAVTVEHLLTLRAGSHRIEVETWVDNRCEDHRLRLIVPTGVHARTLSAGAAFDVLERPVEVIHEPEHAQPSVPTHHAHDMLAVDDGGRGLALLCPGSNEYEARHDEHGAVELCLTLVRAVGWLSRDGFASRRHRAGPCFPAPGAQCLGTTWTRWGIEPYEGDWQAAAIHRAAAERSAQPTVLTGLPKPQLDGSIPPFESDHSLGDGLSLVAFDSPMPAPVIDACKPAEDGRGVIVRVHNPLRSTWHGTLRCDLAGAEACFTNLLEEDGDVIPVEAKESGIALDVAIPPRAIRTIRLAVPGI